MCNKQDRQQFIMHQKAIFNCGDNKMLECNHLCTMIYNIKKKIKNHKYCHEKP